MHRIVSIVLNIDIATLDNDINHMKITHAPYSYIVFVF